MSDRFKFRVWDKDNECYVQDEADWCYLKFDGTIDCGTPSDFDTVPEWHLEQKNAVIEFCTGLRDKTGKLIFEGDVVDQYSPMEDCRRRCVVEWVSEAGGGYICKYLDGKGNPCAHGNSEGTYFDGAWCVVVGNIHDSDTSNQF